MVRMMNSLPAYGGGDGGPMITPTPYKPDMLMTVLKGLVGTGDVLGQRLTALGEQRRTAASAAEKQKLDFWNKLVEAGYSPEQINGVMSGWKTSQKKPGNIFEALAGVGTQVEDPGDMSSRLAGLPKPQKNYTLSDYGLPTDFEFNKRKYSLGQLPLESAQKYASLLKDIGEFGGFGAGFGGGGIKDPSGQIKWGDLVVRGGLDDAGRRWEGLENINKRKGKEGVKREMSLILNDSTRQGMPLAFSYISNYGKKLGFTQQDWNDIYNYQLDTGGVTGGTAPANAGGQNFTW